MAQADIPIDEILFTTLKIESEGDRAEYLNEVCGTNVGLRARVEKLLRAYREAGSFLDSPVVPAAPTLAPPVAEKSGPQIGPYKLLQEIGQGGMGVVYMAEQHEPVRRKVALKIIKPGMDTRQVIARLEAERQALSLMDHPNIAKVLDAGTTAAGRPYFVMELVKGQPITEYCDQRHLTPQQRLDLFLSVCRAIQHAHQKGIIHRDIKPSNVLVAEYDSRPVAKVIDFGVAKAVSQPLTEKTMFTAFGQLVGTLEYMSPEQAKVNQLDIDTRSDIYSLGVLLYELLTGSTPFDKQRLRSAAWDEMLRIIREEEPERPSTRLSSVGAADSRAGSAHQSRPNDTERTPYPTLASIAALRNTEPARLSKLVRGELDWIVMKALEKDRNRRYETAAGFAADLERYLGDEPVLACPPSAGYRLRKFVRRNKGSVLAAAAILAILLAGIAGTTFGLIRAELRRAEAEQARADEVEQRRIADSQRIEVEQARADEAEQRGIAEIQKKKAEQAETETLASYRASTDDAIEHLIGAKPDLGPQERIYLEMTLHRWQAFAKRQGDDERSRAVRAEGHHQAAILWAKLGRPSEARTEYEKAQDLYTKLAAAFPAEPEYQRTLAQVTNRLAFSLSHLGEKDAARIQLETARELGTKLVADYPIVAEYQQILGQSRQNLGALLLELGRRDEARTQFEAARDLQQKLADEFPASLEFRRALSYTHASLGTLLAELGQGETARAEYELARDAQKALADDFPANPQCQFDLAGTHRHLGVLLRDLGQREAARTEFELARDLQIKLAADFPATPRYQSELARTHTSLANLLKSLGQRDAAGMEYERARQLQLKLVAAFPAVLEYQIELGGSYSNYGRLVHSSGLPTDSLQWFDLSIRTLTAVYQQDHHNVAARQSLRSSHMGRAMVFDQLHRHIEAINDWDKTIELDPNVGQFHAGKAISRLQAGHSVEAVAEIEELTKMPDRSAPDLYNFACVYAVACTKIANKKQEYADRALELLRRALEAGFKNAATLANDPHLDSLRQREDFQKLRSELNTRSTRGSDP